MSHRIFRSSEAGVTLIEMMVVTVLISVSALAVAGLFEQMVKSGNMLEFQTKKEQIRTAVLGQLLSNPTHCKCMFAGATQFPSAGTAALTGYTTPTAIGRYAANCAGGVLDPLVSTAGVDGVILHSVALENIVQVGPSWGGELKVGLTSAKSVLGPQTIHFRIPVDVTTTPAGGGNVVFDACSAGGTPVAATSRLQGIPVGAAIVDNFTANNTTHSVVHLMSTYPEAVAISYVCNTSCRDAFGHSLFRITFQNGGTNIYSATPCRTAEITNTNTSWDRRTGIIPIPTTADRFVSEAVITGCDNGNQSNQFSLQLMK